MIKCNFVGGVANGALCRYFRTTKAFKTFEGGIPLPDGYDRHIVEHWDLYSDHLLQSASLPVSNQRKDSLIVSTQNIFNPAYVKHVRSSLQDVAYAKQAGTPSLQDPSYSEQERLAVADIARVMLEKKSDILCLQECSKKVCDLLRKTFAAYSGEDEVLMFVSENALLPGNKVLDNYVVTLIKKLPGISIEAVASRALWNRKYISADTKTSENPRGVERFGPDEWRRGLTTRFRILSPTGVEREVSLANVHVTAAGEGESYQADRCTELFQNLQREAISEPEKCIRVVMGDLNASDGALRKAGVRGYTNLVDQHGNVDACKEEILHIDKILVSLPNKEDVAFAAPVSSSEVHPPSHQAYQKVIAPLLDK